MQSHSSFLRCGLYSIEELIGEDWHEQFNKRRYEQLQIDKKINWRSRLFCSEKEKEMKKKKEMKKEKEEKK